jgi:hypothetical protein
MNKYLYSAKTQALRADTYDGQFHCCVKLSEGKFEEGAHVGTKHTKKHTSFDWEIILGFLAVLSIQ